MVLQKLLHGRCLCVCIALLENHPGLMTEAVANDLLRQLQLRGPGSANLCDRIIHAVLIAGNNRLNLQRFSDGSRDSSDSSAALKIFQRIHIEKGLAVPDLLRELSADLLKRLPLLQPGRRPDGKNSARRGNISGIKNKDLQILIFGCRKTKRIVGSG